MKALVYLLSKKRKKILMERRIDKEFRKVVVRSIIVTCFFLILQLAIFFVSAGRLDLYQA